MSISFDQVSLNSVGSIASNSSRSSVITVISAALTEESGTTIPFESSMIADVQKSGYMRKSKVKRRSTVLTLDLNLDHHLLLLSLQTNKRKFFVLRMNTLMDSNEATLSYYDTEKKFRLNPDPSNQMPRRTTYIKNCWAVHKKYDSKHRWSMAVYTNEDMLATYCDDEKVLNEWIEAIRKVMKTQQDFIPRPAKVLGLYNQHYNGYNSMETLTCFFPLQNIFGK